MGSLNYTLHLCSPSAARREFISVCAPPLGSNETRRLSSAHEHIERIYVTHSAVLRFFKPLLYAAFLRCLLILGGRPHKLLLEAMMAVNPSFYMAGCYDVLHQFGNSTWGCTEQLIIKSVPLHCLLL